MGEFLFYAFFLPLIIAMWAGVAAVCILVWKELND